MATNKGTDQDYLLNEQYKDSTNLRSRIHLHRQYSTNTYGWMRWVFDYIKLAPEDAKVLEIGCGPCDLWLQNLDRIPDGWEIILSDLSPGMIEKGQDLLYDRSQRFDFRVFDSQEIPLEDNSLDTVIANHMLYHVPDLDRALSEIRRVLKPTGRLFAATNGNGHMAEMRALRQKFLASLTEQDGSDHNDGNDDNAQLGGESWGLAFNLDNGDEWLGRHFRQVDLRHYVDSLRVTSSRPLYDYMMSSRVHGVERELGGAYREFLQNAMDAEGGMITIEKETGMFQAWDEDRPLPEAKHAFSFIEDDPNVELAKSPLMIEMDDDDEEEDSTQINNFDLPDP